MSTKVMCSEKWARETIRGEGQATEGTLTQFYLNHLREQVLQMELMFSKLESLETTDAKNEAKKKATNGAGGAGVASDQGDVEEEESTLTLKPVSVQRFHASLGGGHWGIHAYVPVTFSGVHFVRVDCMVSIFCLLIVLSRECPL